MGIVFFCQSCGARFEVDARMAGKKGHCKKCGQLMSIPRAEQVASMAAMPALAGVGIGSGSGASGASIGSMLKRDLSKIGMAPITMDRIPLGRKLPAAKSGKATAMSVLDDADDSKPYMLATPLPKGGGRVSGQASVALGLWRGQVGKLQKLFRSLHGAVYLLSIPFIILFLIGVMAKSRSTALFGATFVVVLAAAGVAAGLANLAAVPLRDGLDGRKMKKPLRRVLEPLGAIAVVIAAFAFIPWLSDGKAPKGTVAERLKASAKGLRQEMKGNVGKAAGSVSELDLEKLGAEAQEKLSGAQQKLKGVGDRVRGTAEGTPK